MLYIYSGRAAQGGLNCLCLCVCVRLTILTNCHDFGVNVKRLARLALVSRFAEESGLCDPVQNPSGPIRMRRIKQDGPTN